VVFAARAGGGDEGAMNDAPDLLALPVAEALLLERQPGEQQLFELCRAATGLSALQLDPVFAQFDADDARTFEALQTSLGRMAPIHAAGVVRSMLRWMREQVGIVPLDFDGPAPLGDDAAPLGDGAGRARGCCRRQAYAQHLRGAWPHFQIHNSYSRLAAAYPILHRPPRRDHTADRR
jgi:hypothetical protein